VSAEFKKNLLRVLALIFVIGLSVFLVSIRDQITRFAALGYPGIFLTALLANATVLFPAPGAAIVFSMGAVFNPLGVALAAGIGGGLGEISGYLAGLSGQAIIERMDMYNRVAPQIKKYGPFGVFVFACIPNPLFDIVGISAGALKMPFWSFVLAAIAGNIIKMALFAYAGSLSINWLLPVNP
jgi:membrane protein YqaA with SNARE-associated domain